MSSYSLQANRLTEHFSQFIWRCLGKLVDQTACRMRKVILSWAMGHYNKHLPNKLTTFFPFSWTNVSQLQLAMSCCHLHLITKMKWILHKDKDSWEEAFKEVEADIKAPKKCHTWHETPATSASCMREWNHLWECLPKLEQRWQEAPSSVGRPILYPQKDLASYMNSKLRKENWKIGWLEIKSSSVNSSYSTKQTDPQKEKDV